MNLGAILASGRVVGALSNLSGNKILIQLLLLLPVKLLERDRKILTF